MTLQISVIVPTVPPRAGMLAQALASVDAQTLQPTAIIVQEDTDRAGAAVTRQRAQDRVRTEWTAPLDDDDLLYPQHLQRLADVAVETGADLVFPWYDCTGNDPFPQLEGKPWANDDPHVFPVTFLARTEAIRAAGGWQVYPEVGSNEDWRLILTLVDMDAHIVHLNERTWQWRHWGGNSSGRADRVPW